MTQQQSRKCRWNAMVIFIVLMVALLAGWQYFSMNQKEESKRHYGTWLQNPKAVMPFNLQSTDGSVFTEKSLRGHWSLVFFGFTNCPDMCPNTLKAFHIISDELREDKKVETIPQFYFVSIDPTRDTLDVLKQYVTSFDRSFIGLRGDLAQVSLLANQMNVTYKNKGNGMIQHSATITVVSPAGEMVAYYPWVDDPKKIAVDLEELIQKDLK